MNHSPRNVRNWWIEIECDGYTKKVAMGPKAKGGGFSIRVHQRHQGSVKADVLAVDGFLPEPGQCPNELRLKIETAERQTFVNTTR